MTLRIEIIGESPERQRLLKEIVALKAFAVSYIPTRDRDVSAQRGRTLIDVAGTRDGTVILHGEASGSIEALPVLTLNV